MSDIDPGTPANGGFSALTKRDGVADAITRMTHVTDEMVEAAQHATRRDGFGIMPHSEVRAALEAALAARKPVNVDGDIVQLITGRYANHPIPMAAVGLIERQAEEIADNEAFVSILQKEVQRLTAERAKLIERQAEEIAELQSAIANREESVLYAKVDEMAAIVERLTAERAELIEALRLVAYPMEDLIRRTIVLDHARALLERLGAVIRD